MYPRNKNGKINMKASISKEHSTEIDETFIRNNSFSVMSHDLEQVRRELLKFIHLIMSTKSKEEMQLETMNYLICNKAIFKECLSEIMEITDGTWGGDDHSRSDIGIIPFLPKFKESNSFKEPDQNTKSTVRCKTYDENIQNENYKIPIFRNSEIVGSSPKQISTNVIGYFQQRNKNIKNKKLIQKDIPNAKGESSTPYYENGNKKMNFLNGVNNAKCSRCNFADVTIRENNDRSAKKRQRTIDQSNGELNKYQDSADNAKRQKKSSESVTRLSNAKSMLDNLMRNFFFGSEVSNPASLDDTEDVDKIIIVKSLINTLINSTSKHQQELVLQKLRTDDVLRRLFLKESARMGKVKIPVFRRDELHLQKNDHTESCSNTNVLPRKDNDVTQKDNDVTQKDNYHLDSSLETSKDITVPIENVNFDLIQLIASSFDLQESEYTVPKNEGNSLFSTLPLMTDDESKHSVASNLSFESKLDLNTEDAATYSKNRTEEVNESTSFDSVIEKNTCGQNHSIEKSKHFQNHSLHLDSSDVSSKAVHDCT